MRNDVAAAIDHDGQFRVRFLQEIGQDAVERGDVLDRQSRDAIHTVAGEASFGAGAGSTGTATGAAAPVGAAVALFAEFVEQHLRDGIERGKDVLSSARDDLEALHALLAIVQNELEIIDWRDVVQVALVVLQDVGNLIDRDILLGQVFLEIAKTLDVFLHFFPLRIGHENDSIDAPQDKLTGRIVNDLAGTV